MTATDSFTSLIHRKGTTLVYRKDQALSVPCTCRTEEGFRDPFWHLNNPSEPDCNEVGFLPQPGEQTEIVFKGFIQAVQSTRATRLSTEYQIRDFAQFEEDDHLGIFPYEWDGERLRVFEWGRSGEDVIYEPMFDRYYTIANVNNHYDPTVSNVLHHFEVGLRYITAPQNIPVAAQ